MRKIPHIMRYKPDSVKHKTFVHFQFCWFAGIMDVEKEKQTRIKRKKHPRYEVALQLFREAKMDLKTIAETLDIRERTLGDWAKENYWERERELFQTTPSRLSERLQQTALRILELSANNLSMLSEKEAKAVELEISIYNKISDAIAKISSSIKRVNDRVDESAAIQVMIRFDTLLVREGALNLARELKPYQAAYYKSLTSNV